MNQGLRRNAIDKKLSTGQIISLTSQEEKTLEHAYGYMAGYAKRTSLLSKIEAKTNEYNQIGSIMDFA